MPYSQETVRIRCNAQSSALADIHAITATISDVTDVQDAVNICTELKKDAKVRGAGFVYDSYKRTVEFGIICQTLLQVDALTHVRGLLGPQMPKRLNAYQ